MLTNLRTIWVLLVICLVANTLGVLAEENTLRERIISGLSQGALGTKKPTVPPTKKPTKATVAPTLKPTKATLAPTLRPTKKATSSPTKKVTVSPTKKSVTPTKEPTKKAKAAAVPSSSPTKKTKTVTSSPTKKTSTPTTYPTKKTKAPVTATLRPTKKTSAPTLAPTKKAAAGASEKSVSPTSAPTKKAVAQSMKKTSSPTTKSLKDALTEAQATPAPSSSTATDASAPKITTPTPTDPVVITLPVDTPSPTNADVVITLPEDTAAPSSDSSADTPSPTGADVVITLPEDTAAPSSDSSAETLSPASADVVITLPEDTAAPSDDRFSTETPASSPTEEVTASPSSVESAESHPGDQSTDAPTESGSEPEATETTAPTSEGNGTVPENTGEQPVDGLTPSPTVAETNETKSNDDNSTAVGMIGAVPALNETSTEAPSATQTSPESNETSTESPSASDLKSSILSSMEQNLAGSSNWTEATLAQLWLVRSAGITSRSAATSALLAAQRACAAHSEMAQTDVTNAIAEINGAVLPQLRSNRTACDELMKAREAEDNRKLREQLEFASASCSRAIRSHEHLVGLLEKIVNGTLSGKACDESLNEQTLQLKQYDVQTEADEINTTNTVLAAIGVAFGFIFLIAHPLPNGWGTVLAFVVAAPYTWAYFAFLASWYAFNLSEPDAWLVSTWWRSYYSTYLLGLAAWLLLICLTGMLYMIMVRNPWFLGIWAGISMGGILGVQINTIGMWQLGYDNNLPPYYTLACCVGSGLILMAIILSIASAVSPTVGAIQHWCIVWIGSYLFVKSIGVLVGSYPNEFDMAPPTHWETYLYIACMWVLAILVFVMQMFLYGINRPLSLAAAGTSEKRKRDSTRSSQSMTVYGGEEKVPLIESPGSASNARNMARQQEVTEFGGVRALRPDSENRRLFV